MDIPERTALIEKYRRGYDDVATALDGITDRELDTRPAPGKWSPREIVHHLADSEMTAAIRLRRLIAEERPVIQGYDQDEFARRLFYSRPIEDSLLALRAARSTSAGILDLLTEEDWKREGTHSEIGRYTMEGWLRIYAAHAHEHARQIRAARVPAG